MTTEKCKELIAEFVKNNQEVIQQAFVEPVDLSPAMLVRNWKRMYKTKNGAVVERAFDCLPYDDQLRGYVIEVDGVVTLVSVEGE